LELERFDAHLDATCGLAWATRISRRMWVGKFLLEQFGSGPIQVERLKPTDIADFVIRPANHYKPGTKRALACALHSYLRFRALTSGDQIEPLVTAIPRTAHWRLAALPSHLSPEEVSRFLDAFDRHSATGKRDYAMARCLLDMGLRASDVAAIQLDDLNWREGTLVIGRGKSRRTDLLPLLVPTGNAIVQYLRSGRPPSTSRALFLRHRPPFHAPITTELVRGAVRRAYARCGLADLYTGTHILRRTAAVRMRCAGASLKEIADVLRHRSLDTTAIYSKVDLPTLSAVAAPWPGGRL
jgi:integrase